jgi:hypothetical protein
LDARISDESVTILLKPLLPPRCRGCFCPSIWCFCLDFAAASAASLSQLVLLPRFRRCFWCCAFAAASGAALSQLLLVLRFRSCFWCLAFATASAASPSQLPSSHIRVPRPQDIVETPVDVFIEEEEEDARILSAGDSTVVERREERDVARRDARGSEAGHQAPAPDADDGAREPAVGGSPRAARRRVPGGG